MRYWFNKFERGCTSVFDEERPGRSADVVTTEIVKNVQSMILADCQKQVREVAEAVGVS